MEHHVYTEGNVHLALTYFNVVAVILRLVGLDSDKDSWEMKSQVVAVRPGYIEEA
jgi:hypothetical protein